jgi:hypothetical protein
MERAPGELDALPVEPEDPAPIHAYLSNIDPNFRQSTERWIINQPGTAFLEFGHEESACGMGVRVVYRMAFDNADGDACPRCIEMVNLWRTDFSEYMLAWTTATESGKNAREVNASPSPLQTLRANTPTAQTQSTKRTSHDRPVRSPRASRGSAGQPGGAAKDEIRALSAL